MTVFSDILNVINGRIYLLSIRPTRVTVNSGYGVVIVNDEIRQGTINHVYLLLHDTVHPLSVQTLI